MHGPFDLEQNEAQKAMNVILTQRGSMFERAGKTQLDTSGFPASKRAEHARNWYTGSTRLLVLSIDGSIYTMNTSGACTERFNGTDGKVWAFESMQDSGNNDRLWAMNGTDNPKKMDSAGTVSDWANTPPNGTMLKAWKNKMVISGVAATPLRLFFSTIANPEDPAATYGTNWIDIKAAEDDTDPITWIDVVQDALIVFKRRSVWAVFEPVNFSNQRLGAPGCEDRFQSVELGGVLYYLARDGIYSVEPNSPPRHESHNISPIFQGPTNYVGVLNPTVYHVPRIAASRDRRLFVAIPTGSSTQNNILLEGIPELRGIQHVSGRRTISDMPWIPHSFPCASLATFRSVNTDDLVAGAGDAAKIHKLFQGTNDDGAPISAYWMGAWRSVIQEEPFERIRRINVMHSGRVVVDLFQDLNSDAPVWSKVFEQPVDPDPLWDGGTWDAGPWDPISPTGLGRGRPEKRGRYHALQFRNDVLDKRFTVHTAELAVRGGKEHT
jgi:hypothetical protein